MPKLRNLDNFLSSQVPRPKVKLKRLVGSEELLRVSNTLDNIVHEDSSDPHSTRDIASSIPERSEGIECFPAKLFY